MTTSLLPEAASKPVASGLHYVYRSRAERNTAHIRGFGKLLPKLFPGDPLTRRFAPPSVAAAESPPILMAGDPS
jgi:hypothetical protein